LFVTFNIGEFSKTMT